MKLEMNLYADKKYKLMYTINKEPDEYNRVIKNFYYEIDSNNYMISTIDEEHYKMHNIINSNKEEFFTLKIPPLKIDLLPAKVLPVMYDYGTSKNKTKDEFTVTIELDNNKLDMSFDKEYYVVYKRDINKCEVFERTRDGLIDLTNKVEEYLFTDKGYLYTNFKEFKMVFTFYSSNDIIESEFRYSDFIKDINPLDILFENIKNRYKISYDDYNIMNSMFYDNENTTHQEYCRYEKVDSEGSLSIYSLHPLLIDLYDVFYIDKDIFRYWVIDKYEVGNENEDDVFIREVYEIKDNESLQQLLNIINTEVITKPILS